MSMSNKIISNLAMIFLALSLLMLLPVLISRIDRGGMETGSRPVDANAAYYRLAHTAER